MASLRQYQPRADIAPAPIVPAPPSEVFDEPAPAVEPVAYVDETAEHAQADAGPAPYNAVTREHYSGKNVFRLLVAEAEHNYGTGGWAGFRQWLTVGRVVRKGEKATHIVRIQATRSRDENGEPIDGPKVAKVRTSAVFHFDQTEVYVPRDETGEAE